MYPASGARSAIPSAVSSYDTCGPGGRAIVIVRPQGATLLEHLQVEGRLRIHAATLRQVERSVDRHLAFCCVIVANRAEQLFALG